MIQIMIENMSCGHCQLNIRAELESHHYKVIMIDMEHNAVLIDTNSSELNKIKKILSKIHYLVSEKNQVLDLVEYTVWDEKLDNEVKYELLLEYLTEQRIELVGFDTEQFGYKILCDKNQLIKIMQFIQEL